MKYITLILVSFLLISCQGLDLDTDNFDSDLDTDLKFNVATDLSNKIIFSDKLLRRDIKDGFILRIDELGSTLKEIAFVNNNANETIFGDYSWELVNDKLQISYPSAITCTTTKTAEPDDYKFDSRVFCSNGTPINARIEGELIKPISLRFSAFSNKAIKIKLLDDSEEILDFDSDTDGTLTYTESNSGAQNGLFKQSTYTNVVRIEYIDNSDYSLFILLEGDISDGTLLDLRFEDDTDNKDDLKSVRIYTLRGNNWDLEEERTAIMSDN